MNLFLFPDSDLISEFIDATPNQTAVELTHQEVTPEFIEQQNLLIKNRTYKMSTLKYIRKYYNVPAKRGKKVTYTKESGQQMTGKITSADRGYLRIKFDGHVKTYPAPFHPTYNLVYHET